MEMPLNDFFTRWGHHGWGMGSGMMGWGSSMGWLGTILMAAFWIAIVVGIVLLIRWLVVWSGAAGRKVDSENSALEILNRRYAHGEIEQTGIRREKESSGILAGCLLVF